MSHSLTSVQARTVAYTDLIVHNEIDYIERQIIAAGLLGELETTITDGTTMTESTPTITLTGTSVGGGAVFTPGNTIVIAGTTVTFSSGAGAGTNVYQAVADINAAAIAGLTASTDGDIVTLTYEPSQSTWSLVIADGTELLASLGLTAGTYTATTPDSVGYYNAWTGDIDDRKLAHQMSQVINHFQGEGFSIIQKKNTTTGNTFYWGVYW